MTLNKINIITKALISDKRIKKLLNDIRKNNLLYLTENNKAAVIKANERMLKDYSKYIMIIATEDLDLNLDLNLVLNEENSDTKTKENTSSKSKHIQEPLKIICLPTLTVKRNSYLKKTVVGIRFIIAACRDMNMYLSNKYNPLFVYDEYNNDNRFGCKLLEIEYYTKTFMCSKQFTYIPNDIKHILVKWARCVYIPSNAKRIPMCIKSK